MKTASKVALILYGLIWLGVGCMLLSKGISLLVTRENPVLATSEEISLLLIVAGMIVGVFKARFVLKKVAHRVVNSVLQSTTPFKAVFSVRTVLLVVIMMALGRTLRAINTPLDILGFIDVAVGSALIQGAVMMKQAAQPQEIK